MLTLYSRHTQPTASNHHKLAAINQSQQPITCNKTKQCKMLIFQQITINPKKPITPPPPPAQPKPSLLVYNNENETRQGEEEEERIGRRYRRQKRTRSIPSSRERESHPHQPPVRLVNLLIKISVVERIRNHSWMIYFTNACMQFREEQDLIVPRGSRIQCH